MNNVIDFVIPWVDGADEAWYREKQKYRPDIGTDAEDVRYRDWDNLQYWFRAVEMFAPWVHKIYFVTWGHLPDWLNVNHPKLVIVNHRDYIPAQYLPTFSSHPIELNFHRISGLSEQFVYFNDDMFLTDNVKPEDFFKEGLPRDCCIESAVMQDDYNDPFAHILINTCSLINMHYDKHSVIKQNRKKWFSPAYGKTMLRNVLMYPYHQFASFKFHHIPSPFLKQSFEAVWKMEPEILETVCHNKFRSVFDVNQYAMKYYQFVNGKFLPQSPKVGKFFIPGRDNEAMCEAIIARKYKMICINDDGKEDDFDSIKARVNGCFASILPEKSSFERG